MSEHEKTKFISDNRVKEAIINIFRGIEKREIENDYNKHYFFKLWDRLFSFFLIFLIFLIFFLRHRRCISLLSRFYFLISLDLLKTTNYRLNFSLLLKNGVRLGSPLEPLLLATIILTNLYIISIEFYGRRLFSPIGLVKYLCFIAILVGHLR